MKMMMMMLMMMMMTLMKLVNSATKFRHGIDKFYQPNSGLRSSRNWDEAIYRNPWILEMHGQSANRTACSFSKKTCS